MLKFWKKKIAAKSAAAGTIADPDAVVPIVPEADDPALNEAMAEIVAPADLPHDHERFAAPTLDPAVPPPAVAVPEQPSPEQSTRRSWRERLSGNAFARGLSSLFVRHPTLDDNLLDELETTLITADVGIEASTMLVESLRRRMHKREFADADALLAALRGELTALLKPVEKPLDI
ncbi:MAG TPA: signal recognition particle receptor subunit alpha, partial [Rhodanobacter sp.]|nr:signal recognition particle receptor subunit alpha [Rhodanobacter sp.]